jgi:hypothetical protein
MAAAVAALCPAAAARAPTPVATPLVWTRLPIDVPPAIQASLPERGLELVSVVTADIDADGDLDVVASDSKLDLLVWVNDGQGHLSRQVRRSTTWLPASGEPALHDRPIVATVSVQNEPSPVGPDSQLAFAARAPASLAPQGTAQAFAAALISNRIPRAPPTALGS